MGRNAPLASSFIVLACIALTCVPAPIIESLAFNRQLIFSGQIWRLWSAHLVHFSAQHALVDTAVFFIAGAMAESETGTRRFVIGLALGAPLISLGLLFVAPELSHYRGASGIAMMVAILVGTMLWKMSASNRMLLVLLAAGLVIKTAYEVSGLSPDWAGLPHNTVVVWQAHVLGAICGSIMAVPIVRRPQARSF